LNVISEKLLGMHELGYTNDILFTTSTVTYLPGMTAKLKPSFQLERFVYFITGHRCQRSSASITDKWTNVNTLGRNFSMRPLRRGSSRRELFEDVAYTDFVS